MWRILGSVMDLLKPPISHDDEDLPRRSDMLRVSGDSWTEVEQVGTAMRDLRYKSRGSAKERWQQRRTVKVLHESVGCNPGRYARDLRSVRAYQICFFPKRGAVRIDLDRSRDREM